MLIYSIWMKNKLNKIFNIWKQPQIKEILGIIMKNIVALSVIDKLIFVGTLEQMISQLFTWLLVLKLNIFLQIGAGELINNNLQSTKQQLKANDNKQSVNFFQSKQRSKQQEEDQMANIRDQKLKLYNKQSHFVFLDKQLEIKKQKQMFNRRYELFWCQRPWKTEYITIKGEPLQINKKQRKLMHKECRSYKREQKNKNNKQFQNQNARNRAHKNGFYFDQKQFMMIIKHHDICQNINNSHKQLKYKSQRSIQKLHEKNSVSSKKAISLKCQNIFFQYTQNKNNSFLKNQGLNKYQRQSQKFFNNKKSQSNQQIIRIQNKKQAFQKDLEEQYFRQLKQHQSQQRKRSRFIQHNQQYLQKPKDKYSFGMLWLEDQIEKSNKS